jgi:hypothetical protein
MTNISNFLEKRNYILRSGGAKGSDEAFEKGLDCKEDVVGYRLNTFLLTNDNIDE